jgi:hypothetical protein
MKEKSINTREAKLKRFDVFLSYSSDDREAIIVPFLETATKKGINAWCDFHEIIWGDSIVEKIHEGMSSSSAIIAFISHSYLRKPWPLKELRASLAKQLSGGPTVLPVLLGVSVEERNEELPFLSDIKHISLWDYNLGEHISTMFFEELTTALEIRKANIEPFTVGDRDELGVLSKPIRSASFGTHYRYFTILTHDQSMEIGFRKHVVELVPLLKDFFLRFSINDSSEIACVWANNERTPDLYIALSSGNLFIPHRASLHNPPEPKINLNEYIRTGAPPDPVCITVCDRTREIVLGYQDGSIFILGKSGQIRQECNSPVTCLDASAESILVSGHFDGTINVWSRRDFNIQNTINSKVGPVCSLSVCRGAGNAIFATGHSNGKILIWSYGGEFLRMLKTERGTVSALAFFPEGYEYLSSADNNVIDIWNYRDGRKLQTLSGLPSQVITLQIGTACERFFVRTEKHDLRITAGHIKGQVSSWRVMI